jgi:hypothetical protein
MAGRVAPLALVGLAIAGIIDLGLLLTLVDVVMEEPAPLSKAAWSPQRPTSEEPIGAARPINSYQQILARPVFFKTREPFVARPIPVAIPAQAPKPPPPVRVVVDPGISVGGIMISGGVRKAYLHKTSEPNGVWVREGDEYVGWKVQSINVGSAKLRQNDRTIELPLYAERSSIGAPSSSNSLAEVSHSSK